jgi:ABC-type amino acid transport substrate-binding protein
MIFYAKANPRAEEIQKIKSIDDMRKFSQGDILGNGFAEANFKGLKIDWANSRDQVFKKIAAGHNDITVAGDLPAKWQLRQLSLADQFAAVPLAIGDAQTFNFAIRKSLAGGDAMLRQLDAALKAARADGTLATSEAKYS